MDSNTKTINHYIRNNRTELMGICIIWVVWFHSIIHVFLPDSNPIFLFINGVLEFTKLIGYGGVDIFLFVSGFGIYHSLSKNSVSTFIFNRCNKIIPVWWIYLVLYTCLSFFFDNTVTKHKLLSSALFVGFWQGKSIGNWYVYVIVLFYLISPVIYSLIHDSKNKLKCTVFIICIGLLISFTFIDRFLMMMSFSRIPVFVLGFFFAAAMNDFAMNRKRWIAVLAVCALGIFILHYTYIHYYLYLDGYGMWWYPFILIAPSLSVLLCGLLEKLKAGRAAFLAQPLKIFGNASLEILLVSDFIFEFCVSFFIYWLYAAIIYAVLSIILGLLFHYSVEWIKKISLAVIRNRHKGDGKNTYA